MINNLEQLERAAHRGDSDMVFFTFQSSDRPCMSSYDLYYVVHADREGWIRRTPA
jgi:hypothetical protein